MAGRQLVAAVGLQLLIEALHEIVLDLQALAAGSANEMMMLMSCDLIDEVLLGVECRLHNASLRKELESAVDGGL